MPQVLLVTTARGDNPLHPYQREDFRRMCLAAQSDRFGIHTLTDNPEVADLILFIGSGDPDYLDVRRHPYTRKYREKCFLFDSGDRVIPFLPGVYASIERRDYSLRRVRSGFYLRVFENNRVQFDRNINRAPWLFSFVGAVANAPVRRRLALLKHPRYWVSDTSSESLRLRRTGAVPADDYQLRYTDVLRQSKFILCPRGCGTSSWRLFETMKAARVPVIISDQWVPPEGPRWNAFSLRVGERHIERLPQLLEENEARAATMGMEARRHWEEWFSREVAFHRVVESCLAIRTSRAVPEVLGRWPAYLRLLRPYNFRHHILGRILRQIRQTPGRGVCQRV